MEGMIGREGTFRGGLLSLDVQQYLEQPAVPKELCPRIIVVGVLHAGKKVKAV